MAAKNMPLMLCVLATLGGIPARAAELKPETAAFFDRYIRAVEARMDEDIRDNQFLVVDRLPESRREQAYDQLKQGQIYIEELHARQDDGPLHIPGALIHHWSGVIFIPKATLSEALSILQDYDQHENIYKSQIRRSKLIEHSGDVSRIYFQLFSKSIVKVVLNVDFDVRDTTFGSTRHQVASRSTRIAEVANPGMLTEHEHPVGNDHGYMWRLYTYWRVEEKDGGVYVQNESVALSRAVPAVLAWLVNPLLKSIPRDILLHLLTDTRNAVNSPPVEARALNINRCLPIVDDALTTAYRRSEPLILIPIVALPLVATPGPYSSLVVTMFARQIVLNENAKPLQISALRDDALMPAHCQGNVAASPLLIHAWRAQESPCDRRW